MARVIDYTVVRILRYLRALLTQLEPAVLMGCFLLTAGIWIFAELSDDVFEGDFMQFDTYVMEQARILSKNSPLWVQNAVRDLSALGSFTVLSVITLFVACFFVVTNKPHSAVYLLTAVAGGSLLNFLLKGIFARPRPEQEFHLVEVATAGFPSGHAATTAIVCLTLAAIICTAVQAWAVRIYILLSAVLISALVGLSRIYLGVHYATDVLAGWMLGFLWSTACWTIARWLQQRRSLERATEPTPK